MGAGAAPPANAGRKSGAARLESVGYLVAAGLAGTLATLLGDGWASATTTGRWWPPSCRWWATPPVTASAAGCSESSARPSGWCCSRGSCSSSPAPWQTVLVIAACQFGAEMFIARQYVLAQIFVTPLALIRPCSSFPRRPRILLRDRIFDTVIGAAVGIAVVAGPNGVAPAPPAARAG